MRARLASATRHSYYRFNFDPVHVATNIVEYADRSMTLGVLVLIATAVALKRLPALTSREWRLVWMGSVWLVGGFAATIWLPVRSSLYAVFPSVGLALAVGTLLAATARNAEPQRRLARRNRWSDSAVSAAAHLLATECAMDRTAQPECRHDPGDPVGQRAGRNGSSCSKMICRRRANFRHVFGGQLPEAAAAALRRRVVVD